MGGWVAWWRRRRREHDGWATDAVSRVGDFVDCLASDDLSERATARKALTLVLPVLTAEHAHLLTRRQRGALWHCLADASHVDADLQVAILEAVEHIGDAGALHYVEDLADTAREPAPGPWEEERLARHVEAVCQARLQRDKLDEAYHEAVRQWPTASDDDLRPLRQEREEAEAAYRSAIAEAVYTAGGPVHTAARRCLPLLHARIERLSSASGLLRPAAPPAETLLRPAANAPTADPAALLRPAAAGPSAAPSAGGGPTSARKARRRRRRR